MSLITGNKILKGHPHGFNSFTVVGDRGIGKSTYALIVVYEIFRKLGYEKNQAWNEAINCCKFHIQDVIKFLKISADSDDIKPVIIWDDIAIHASGTKYFLNMRMVDQLKAVLDTIRLAISGLIMTCPSTKGLLSILKVYDDYKLVVRYSKRGGYYREITAYKWNTLPSGKRIIRTQYTDNYNCYIPNWVFDKYMVMRKNATKETLDRLEQSISKKG